MRNRWRLILAGLAAVLAVAVWIWWAGREQPGGELLPGITDRRPPAPVECTSDPAPVPTPTGADGRPLNYLHTCGSRLFDSSGREVRITGINWFGMETGTLAPHGLWSRNWKSIIAQIADLGYNAIRLPLSNDAIAPGQMPQGINYERNPDLHGLTSLEILDAIVDEAGRRGLRVMLDRHRPTSAGQSDLWYTEQVSEERWIEDWVMLADRYRNNDTVIAVDLHNEPKGAATWGTGDPATDWRLAAEMAGNAILDANPYLLIVVEGIEQYDGDWYWWGGNLMGVRDAPVNLKLPGRLVYSAHDYGPGVYRQGWFDAADFPNNLPGVWDAHWGYLQNEGIAPVLIGEFGGRSVDVTDDEGMWQRSLLKYLEARGFSYFAWSLNPNSGDTGGLLGDDWLNEVSEKQELYRAYLAPTLGNAQSGGVAADGREMEVLYRTTSPARRTNNVSFSLQVVDLGGQQLDLTRLELRYWFTHGAQANQPVVEVDHAAVGRDVVNTEIVETKQGGQDSYLRITFQGEGAELRPYDTTGDILVRLHADNWAEYDQANDYSFSPDATGYRASEKITAYIDGKLVWGREP